MTVQSVYGEGSTFSVYLPLVVPITNTNELTTVEAACLAGHLRTLATKDRSGRLTHCGYSIVRLTMTNRYLAPGDIRPYDEILAREAAPRRVAFLLALGAAAACNRDNARERAAADSVLARDLALAGQQTAVQPTLSGHQRRAGAAARAGQAATARRRARTGARRRAPRRIPRRRAPAPQPVAQTPPPQPEPINALPAPAAAPVAAPAAAPSEIGAGVNFGLTSGSKVCSNTNLPGDKLVATLNETVTGSNGAVIPAGSTVVLEVASVTPGENAESAQIAFRVRSVVVNDKTYNVDATVTPMAPLEKSKVADGDPNADKKKVIGGAIAGAILGQMIGHNTKGTVIGAAAGAAAGAAVAKSGEKWQACLPAGAPLRLTLNAPLVISS